jgi:hypothetical protein
MLPMTSATDVQKPMGCDEEEADEAGADVIRAGWYHGRAYATRRRLPSFGPASSAILS